MSKKSIYNELQNPANDIELQIKIIKLQLYRFNLFLIFLLICPISFAITDTNPSNNVKNFTINVVESHKLNITIIPLDNPTNYDSALNRMIEFINKTYPIADEGLIIRNGTPRNVELFERVPFATRLIRNLDLENVLSANNQRVIGIVPLGWVDNRTLIRGLGFAERGFFAAVIEPDTSFRYLAAHEMGHTFLLCDEYNEFRWFSQDKFGVESCPNGDSNNNGFLDNTCNPDGCPSSTIGKLIPWSNSNGTESNLHNFMGNGLENTAWVANDSYIQLLNEFTAPIITGEVLAVSGMHNETDDTVQLFTMYRIPSRRLTLQNQTQSGNFTLETLDQNNVVLTNLSFATSSIETGFNGSSNESTNVSFFLFFINYTSNIKKINIKKNNVIKAEKNRSANSPSLNLTFPIGNEIVSNKMNITYNASDADNDNINYAILISSDNGNTFSTLEIDYTNKTLFVNTTTLSDGKNYKVKVLATDGINTNTTISQNTFEIDNDLRITNLTTLHENKSRKIFFYRNKNTLEDRLNNIAERFDTGESVINLTTNHSLNSSEEIMIFIEYNYITRGQKTLTATATSNSLTETESTSINVPDIEVINLVILDSTITKRIFRFDIKNNLDVNLTNVNWTFDTNNSYVINSTINTLLQPDKQLIIYIDYNFTTTGNYNINATARNGSLSDYKNLTIII